MSKIQTVAALFLLVMAPLSAPVLLAANDEQAAPTNDGDAVPGIQRKSAPAGATVGFANLVDGATVPPTFTVKFMAEGMGVAPSGTDLPDTGHHHLLIDVDELPDLNLPLPKNEQFIHFGGGQTEAEVTLPEGQHTLQLVFGDFRHVPHDPVVRSERITITVSAEAADNPIYD